MKKGLLFCCLALLVLGMMGAMATAEVLYLPDLGIPLSEGEIELLDIGYITQQVHKIEPEMLTQQEGFYALALDEEQASVYDGLVFRRLVNDQLDGYVNNRGQDLGQNLYAVEVQTSGLLPGTLGSVHVDNLVVSYPGEAAQSDETVLRLPCTDTFTLYLYAADDAPEEYAGWLFCRVNVDLSDISEGESKTITVEPAYRYPDAFDVTFTKGALLREARPAARVAYDNEEPFTVYFMDPGFEADSVAISTLGMRQEDGRWVGENRVMDPAEYTVRGDAPEGMIAVELTAASLVPEMDGYTFSYNTFMADGVKDGVAMTAEASRQQTLLPDLYVYSVQMRDVPRDAEIQMISIRMRGLDDPGVRTRLVSLKTEDAEVRLALDLEDLKAFTFVAGEMVGITMERLYQQGEPYAGVIGVEENMTGVAVGDSLTTYIMDGTGEQPIEVTLTKLERIGGLGE